MSNHELRRRRFLQGGIAAGSLFLPAPFAWVWAQSEGTLKLMRLPKIALVFGNSKYKDAPLKNPTNDAKTIGEALSASGFTVTARLDATRAEMAAALDAYVRELNAKKCVGLFYYAGHGVQLAWKNYMLPVDAEIDTIDDVQKKAVEVNALTDGLVKAANPLNVIILDACRDNPFGTAKPTQAKGLSQMDAPINTILAYATAPGNVASDGEGVNGLYTEHFLKEVKVPEAKLEDVFKRVRLAVRRRSNGAQIPWESTSLEEDYWFIPPKELKKLSDAEKDRLFEQELALYETVKESMVAAPLEDYLRRHPSGAFSELVQLQLDKVLSKQGEKKIHVAPQEGNPFTKGSAEFNTDMRVGDSYVYRIVDLYTKVLQRTVTSTVTQVSEMDVTFSDGLVTDLLGNIRRYPDGRVPTANQGVPVEFAVGRKWTSRTKLFNPKGFTLNVSLEYRIVAREKITVPAGTFDAFRIERQGFAVGGPGFPAEINSRQWWVPDQIRRPVAAEDFRKARNNVLEATRTELMSYKQS